LYLAVRDLKATNDAVLTDQNKLKVAKEKNAAALARYVQTNEAINAVKVIKRTDFTRQFCDEVLVSLGRHLTHKCVEPMLMASTILSRQYKCWTWDDDQATAAYNKLVLGQKQQPSGTGARPKGAGGGSGGAGGGVFGGGSSGGSAGVGSQSATAMAMSMTPEYVIPGSVGDFGYHRAPPGSIQYGGVGLRMIPSDHPEVSSSLLRGLASEWVLAVRGPVTHLQQLCDTRPEVAPVKYVPKMRHAAERLGIVTEIRCGCVCLSMHNPASPGTPFNFWFPLEAVGALPGVATAQHQVRMLSDQTLVERLCNTKPDGSPVKWVKAMGLALGKVGQLVESRGHIVKVKFQVQKDSSGTPTPGKKRSSSGAEALAGGRASAGGFTESTLWLPKEAVVVVTPWPVGV